MRERIDEIENKMRQASIFKHGKLKGHAETCMYAGPGTGSLSPGAKYQLKTR